MSRPETPRKYAWCTWYGAPKSDGTRRRPHRAFKTRDGSAFAEIHEVLAAEGWAFEGQLFQPSDIGKKRNDNSIPTLTKFEEWSFIRKYDLILMTMRPPISDEPGVIRKATHRSHTWLEIAILDSLHQLIRECDREGILFIDDVYHCLEKIGRAEYSEIVFFQKFEGAWYKAIGKYRGSEEIQKRLGSWQSTCTFVTYLPEIWSGSNAPALLAIWGMSGNDTLRTCHLLRHDTQYRQILLGILHRNRPHLLMIEMSRVPADKPLGQEAERSPIRIGQMLEGFKIRTILDATLEITAQREYRGRTTS